MARLQDFQSVTPSISDNLLIVQPQGQGLSTLDAVGSKIANDATVSSLSTASKKLAGAINELNTNKPNISVLSNLITLAAKSGGVAAFKTDIADKLYSCYVNIMAAQSGNGTPALDNVRTLSGWTSCNFTHAGKNMISISNLSFAASQNRTEFLGNDIWLGAGTYTLSFTISASITSTRNRPLYYDFTNSANVYAQVDYNTSGRQSWTFTLTQKKKVSFRWWIVDNNNAVNITDFQLEFAETNSSYQAYKGITTNLPFNTTVWGGKLDVFTGKLEVTHQKIVLDGTQALFGVNWQPKENSVGWNYQYSVSNNKPVDNIVMPNMLCDKFPTDTYNHLFSRDIVGVGVYNTTYAGLFVRTSNTSLTTSTAINAWLADNPLTIVFELATPTIIQLTPIEVVAFLLENAIFADCGDIDLKYLETFGNAIA